MKQVLGSRLYLWALESSFLEQRLALWIYLPFNR